MFHWKTIVWIVSLTVVLAAANTETRSILRPSKHGASPRGVPAELPVAVARMEGDQHVSNFRGRHSSLRPSQPRRRRLVPSSVVSLLILGGLCVASVLCSLILFCAFLIYSLWELCCVGRVAAVDPPSFHGPIAVPQMVLARNDEEGSMKEEGRSSATSSSDDNSSVGPGVEGMADR